MCRLQRPNLGRRGKAMTPRTRRIEALKLSARHRMSLLSHSQLDRTIAVAIAAAAEWLECDRGELDAWKEESLRLNLEAELESLTTLGAQEFQALRDIYFATIVYSVRWVELAPAVPK